MRWNQLLIELNANAPAPFSMLHIAVNPVYRKNDYSDYVEEKSEYDVLDYTFTGGDLVEYEVKVRVEEEQDVKVTVVFKEHQISFPISGVDEHLEERLALSGRFNDEQEKDRFKQSIKSINGWLCKAYSVVK